VIKPASKAFTVGAAAGVDFPCSEVAGAERFTLVPEGEPHTVRFARGMNGTLWRGEGELSLQAAVDGGEAERDGDGYAVVLGPRDAVVLELGGIAVEAVPVAVPKPVKADPLEAIDLRMLNILAVVFVLFGAAVVSAVTQAGEEEYADDASPQTKLLARFIAPPPPAIAASAPAVPVKEKKAPSKAGEAPKQNVIEKGVASKGRDDAKQVAQALRSLDGLFKGGAGDALAVAMGGMKNAAVAANGNHGLGLRGDADGGGGGETIGLGGIRRPGRGFGPGGPPDGAGILCKAGTDCKQKPPLPDPESTVTVIGMDKELIRHVIHQHRSEVRYCYELELTKNPSLQGKTAVKFLISGSGAVTASSVVESTVRSTQLEKCVEGRVRTWQFPKPPGGGTVTVTYPFVFHATGK